MDKAKGSIEAIIEKYQKAKEAGVINRYNEEETKNAFIMPLFEALGWDFSQKDEVSAEEQIISSGRVDYGFYINNRAKFYLEAKSLKADLHREEFARQAIRYSFNKGVTWAVLTDFESIKVFNAQAVSNYLGDKLLFEIKYTEYLDRFDELWLLSRESIINDLIDREAEKRGKKLQKIPITELLYKDLNECRKLLSHSLGAYNTEVSRDLLDEGVQKLLDRLVFIRVAEDRKIEPSILIPLLNQWRTSSAKIRLYESMIHKFRELDEIYNSNLFTPHPFEKWEDDGGSLQKVIDILYGKKGYYEYDFSIMPADILGSVYENYLGYMLSKSQKGLTLDKSSEKRKEQGIYYTPTFIVDYIVRSSLKPILDKCKSVNDLKKVKVLDPACGSGSFLVKALEVIVEKYKEFAYDDNENLRIQIILENLYGVDLDEQAIEIARLNLLVSALEQRGKLPKLDKNIKNGNSLISGTDKDLIKYFGKNYRDKKPFTWEEEFPDVFKQGGFDVIVGNPPYVNMYKLQADDVDFFRDKFISASNYFDLFSLFIEKSTVNLKAGGSLGFIVPSLFLKGVKFGSLRNYVNINVSALSIKEMGDSVFANVSMPTCIISLTKGENNSKTNFFESKVNIFKREGMITLGEVSSIKRGLEIGQDKIIEQAEIKCISGRNIARYAIKSEGYISLETYAVFRKSDEIFKPPKLLVRETGNSIVAAYDDSGYVTTRSLYNIKLEDSKWLLYILGILNSKLYKFYFKTYISPDTQIFPKIRIEQLKNIPLILVDNKRKTLTNLVFKIVKLSTIINEFPDNSNKWNSIKKEIEEIDKKIDEEVYNLFSLTEEEIAIVEKTPEH